MPWRRYDTQHPVACRTPTGPVGWAVCALASDAHPPARPHSSSVMGARRGVARGVAALPRRHTLTGGVDGPQKTDGDAPSRVDGSGAPHAYGLCGSADHTRLAPGHTHDTDRAVPHGWHAAVPPLPRVDASTGSLGTGFFGDTRMLQLPPQSRIVLATEPVELRRGIAGRCAVGRPAVGDNPLAGALSVLRHRAGTARTL